MKNIPFYIYLAIGLLTACQKTKMAPAAPTLQGKMLGKWSFVSITTVLHDSTGKFDSSNTIVYSNVTGDYFQFNNDKTWTEGIVGTPEFTGILAYEFGTYVVNSDTTFTLLGPNSSYETDCKVASVSDTSLVFSHLGLPNSDFGYLEYIFNLSK